MGNKKLKFAILNDLHVGPEAYYKGQLRKLTSNSLSFLDLTIQKLNDTIHPEFIFQLGDMIEDSDYDTDISNYTKALNIFKKSNSPVYHLIGNHERITLKDTDLRQMLGYDTLYYSVENSGIKCIALVCRSIGHENFYIDQEQMSWLNQELENSNVPVIIFIHESLADQQDELIDNFWYIGKPEEWLVNNRAEIREMLEKSGKVKAVFNGHLHWNRMHIHNGIPYITLQSPIENFASNGIPAATYTIIEIDQYVLDVKVCGNDSARYVYYFPQHVNS